MEPLGALLTEEWKAKHVCQSKRMLQTVKYDPKSHYIKFFPQ